MELFAGTSGFSYKEWKGPFYPEDLPAAKMLGFYAGRLPAVEINNTFYRLPKASVLAGWADQVPEHFRFAIKASRRITHFKRLAGCQDETGYLLRGVEALGSRLGVLLFQLSPKLALDAERLEAFLELLPPGTPAAFEFRHPSWQDARVHELLRQRDLAWVVAEDDEEGTAELPATASWGYLRLRRASYTREDLAAWARRVRAAGWERAFVFFKHEDAGAGPRLAGEFLEVARRGAERRPARPAVRRSPHREAG